jgi:hypothetical protein
VEWEEEVKVEAGSGSGSGKWPCKEEIIVKGEMRAKAGSRSHMSK